MFLNFFWILVVVFLVIIIDRDINKGRKSRVTLSSIGWRRGVGWGWGLGGSGQNLVSQRGTKLNLRSHQAKSQKAPDWKVVPSAAMCCCSTRVCLSWIVCSCFLATTSILASALFRRSLSLEANILEQSGPTGMSSSFITFTSAWLPLLKTITDWPTALCTVPKLWCSVFGARAHTIELNDTFLFCVAPSKHFSRSSGLHSVLLYTPPYQQEWWCNSNHTENHTWKVGW